MNHTFSTRALVMLFFLMIIGGVSAGVEGSGTADNIVKWNTTETVMDSNMNEDTTGETLNMKYETVNITESGNETTLIIDNSGSVADAQLQFALSQVVKLTMGIDDSAIGDPFYINYGTGLDTDYELAIDSTTVSIGEAKFTYGAETTALGCDTTPSVLRTNIYRTYRSNCDLTFFDGSIEGQPLMVYCDRRLVGHVVQVLDSSDMNLEGGNDFVCVSKGDILHLIQIDGKWWELSRSFK
jgi:hypothetical protein